MKQADRLLVFVVFCAGDAAELVVDVAFYSGGENVPWCECVVACCLIDCVLCREWRDTAFICDGLI